MKVETPQISWHGIESDRGRNAPLLSCSVVESGLTSLREYGQVLATAGNDSVIHLWKLSFTSSNSEQQQQQPRVHVVEPQLDTNPNHIVHLLALRRHERSVNAVRFSPDGLVLATAGDGGSIILWSVPLDKRGNDNGKHFWASVQKESDLDCKVVVGIDDGPTTEDIIDVAWSEDSKSFAVSCIDHNAFVLECTAYNKWKCVAKLKDHTHYVQGVAYDPLGVYLATQGSDRTVRVYSKRQQSQSNSKGSNRELFTKEAMIKYWPDEPKIQQQQQQQQQHPEEKKEEDQTAAKKDPKRYMYADEVMVESFFRRLTWTPDGAFLITPAALWGDSFASLLFARHQFDQPVATLSGKSKV
jgi:chromatin assembly factor 1 subunit B